MHNFDTLQDEITPIDIPACTQRRTGQPVFSESKFLGKARAQLLGVGIIRPAEDAIHVNLYLSQVSFCHTLLVCSAPLINTFLQHLCLDVLSLMVMPKLLENKPTMNSIIYIIRAPSLQVSPPPPPPLSFYGTAPHPGKYGSALADILIPGVGEWRSYGCRKDCRCRQAGCGSVLESHAWVGAWMAGLSLRLLPGHDGACHSRGQEGGQISGWHCRCQGHLCCVEGTSTGETQDESFCKLQGNTLTRNVSLPSVRSLLMLTNTGIFCLFRLQESWCRSRNKGQDI